MGSCVYYISIFLFFNISLEYTHTIIVVYKISIFTFILDIIKSFYTGFYEKGILIMDKKSISKNYYKNNLFTDSISLIPLLLGFPYRY